MGKIIITRISKELDRQLRQEQAGFRKGRGTTEQIYILRNIIEQAAEWRSNLYVLFVDYEKAFDSVHRETLWKILGHYGIPEKLITMIKVMYSNNQCAVVDGEGTSDWFTEIRSKQGCNMSGFLFIMVIDWIMSKTTKDKNFGIRWNFTSKLDDLDYADDIALLSSSKDHIQRKSEILDTISRSTGLIINSAKTKVIRMNNTNEHTITINGTDIEEVDTFIYLGATVSKEGGTDREIRRRLGHARVAYNKLRKIWSSSQFSRKTN